MNIGAIIQARTTSSRLPKKVLLNLPFHSDITVLQQVIRRVSRSKKINSIILATTSNTSDDELEKIGVKENIACFRGSEDDVLDRYYSAAKEHNLDVIVRITSDCPCVDPLIIDKVISVYTDTNCDYVSNTLLRSYPHGMDVEVFSMKSLEMAMQKADSKYDREHVTPYFYNTARNSFKMENVLARERYHHPDIRLTLDTIEDYALFCSVYDNLYEQDLYFSLETILMLFEQKPWMKYINSRVTQKKIYENDKEEIKAAIDILNIHELGKSAKILEKYIY